MTQPMYEGTAEEIADELFDNFGVYAHLERVEIDVATDKVMAALRNHQQLIDDVKLLQNMLSALILLKRHKDNQGKDALYKAQQPQVWARAIETLAETDRPEYKEET